MKIYSILLGLIIMLSTNNSFASELKINVINIDTSRGGNIMVMIFGEDGFPIEHEKALFAQTLPAQQEAMEFTFHIELDELSIKVLHDEDMNGKTTKNWTGIWPKEGLGFSNEQKVSLKGAPKYEHSKLSKDQFKDGVTVSILYP